jgi:hypothetical protein
MGVFYKFFYDFFSAVLSNIANFFLTIGKAFGSIVTDFREYASIFSTYKKDFNAIDWILAVLSILILLALFVLLIYKLYKLLRKYIVFRKKAVEEEELIKEIARLNDSVFQLIDEKNKILAMKVSQIGLQPGDDGIGDMNEQGQDSQANKALKNGVSRFVKLIAVDEKYEIEPFVLEDEQNYTLPQLVDAFRNYACKTMKLYYEKKVIMTFISAMATTRLIILEGISGTGKTSLPYAWGKFLKHESAICAVQPSWRDRSELVGYLNEFTKRFNETDFLKNLYDFNYRSDIGFIVLDEMNLARIEYYFAEILSTLEMPNSNEWKVDIVPDAWGSDPKLIVDGKCQVPTNVWFVGTANNDDSTFTITDKVYDRAVPIQLNTKGAPFACNDQLPMQVGTDYINTLFDIAKISHPMSEDMIKKLDILDAYVIENFRLAFGNRILKQFKDFIPVYVACGGTETEALDYMLTYKILRKFEGLNVAFMHDNIKKLIVFLEKTFGKGNMPEAKAYLERLMKMS